MTGRLKRKRRGWLLFVVILAGLGVGVWLGCDQVIRTISDSQPSTSSPTTPSNTLAGPISATATTVRRQPPAVVLPRTPTVTPTASPTPIPTNTPVPSYLTNHGADLPLIETDMLEDTIVSVINDLRLKDDLKGLVRVSDLDDSAAAHSRNMADSQQVTTRPLETGCGGSGTHVVQWPQVKNFTYRGAATAPTTSMPTVFDRTASETASGVVERIHGRDDPHTMDPHYRYLGIGVVETRDELGFVDFWITLYLSDCTEETLTAAAPSIAAPAPAPVPTVSVLPNVTKAAVTATEVSPTSAQSQTTASFSLGDFTNGRWLEQQDQQLASAIGNLGWVRDGIDERESEAIQDLLYIAVTSRSVVASIVRLSWVQDGIDDVEAGALSWLNNIGSAEVATSVVTLGWVEDGIDEIEVEAIETISYVDYADMTLASSVVSLGWVQDGIDNSEVELIDDIASITRRNAGEASRIVGMPFLETIEPPDQSAMKSLLRLAAFRAEAFGRVMSHEALRDGISDDLVPVVATLNGVARTNPGLIDVLLGSASVLVERRTIALPISGDVVLDIIRAAPGAARSMDLLERSVRGVEEYMGSPLPTNHIVLLYADAVSGSFAGTNFGTHIAVLPRYEIDDESHEARYSGTTITHEVAHYYWSGNRNWVDEGAADLIASIVEGVHTGRPTAVTNAPCAHVDSIADLESLTISREDIGFNCNYSLGERLFTDLKLALGDGRFRQGLRNLYQASQIEDDDADHPGRSVGVDHVREAFGADDGAEGPVIARWYDGTVPHDNSRLDSAPVDPTLSAINGRIDEAYVRTTEDGPAVSTISERDVNDWVYLTLKYSYSVPRGSQEVALEIVEYFEDGFEFRRRSRTLTAEARYIGGTAWFSVGQSPSREWASGRYVVYVYADGQKVAEVEYDVTP